MDNVLPVPAIPSPTAVVRRPLPFTPPVRDFITRTPIK